LCLIILTDLVEDYTLEYLETQKIFQKKYAKILQIVNKTPLLQKIYTKFLGGVRWELEEFDGLRAGRDFREESNAKQLFKEVVQIVYHGFVEGYWTQAKEVQ